MNEDVNLVVYWRGGTAYSELAYKIVRTEMLVKNRLTFCRLPDASSQPKRLCSTSIRGNYATWLTICNAHRDSGASPRLKQSIHLRTGARILCTNSHLTQTSPSLSPVTPNGRSDVQRTQTAVSPTISTWRLAVQPFNKPTCYI